MSQQQTCKDLFFRLYADLCERRYGAKLLQKAQPVCHGPVFYKLATRDTVDHDALHRYELTIRGDTQTLSCKGPPRNHTGHNLIPFGDLVLDGMSRIREGSAKHGV